MKRDAFKKVSEQILILGIVATAFSVAGCGKGTNDPNDTFTPTPELVDNFKVQNSAVWVSDCTDIFSMNLQGSSYLIADFRDDGTLSVEEHSFPQSKNCKTVTGEKIEEPTTSHFKYAIGKMLGKSEVEINIINIDAQGATVSGESTSIDINLKVSKDGKTANVSALRGQISYNKHIVKLSKTTLDSAKLRFTRKF